MTPFLIYAIILLIAFSAAVSRYSGRRLASVRNRLADEEEAVRGADRTILALRHALDDGAGRLASLDEGIDSARAAVAAAERVLAQVRAAPMERHFVFDRLEPRPGIIWTAEVRRVHDPAVPQRLLAAWGRRRDILLVAGSHGEAMERLFQRYPRQAGFEIGQIVPCSLFESRTSAEGADAPDRARRVPRRQTVDG